MFLLDTNVLVYALTDSPYRQPCAAVVHAAAERRTHGYVSTAVLEELWHLELGEKIDGLAGVTADYFAAFSPLLSVTDEVFRLALEIAGPRLGSADRIHAATCLEWGMESIVTADAAFDGVRGLRRVDPLDASALDRLLASDS